MNDFMKDEIKGKIEKVIKETISDEEVLSMQELEDSEGGRICNNSCVICTSGLIY